jgi:hypothetical protein
MMGIQLQWREGAVKKSKNGAIELLAKNNLRQHAVDAGGVAFIAIEHCAICKAKDLNTRGIKKEKFQSAPTTRHALEIWRLGAPQRWLYLSIKRQLLI